MLRDLRYSVRALARQRAFTFTAVTVLGLAISMNTAVFSIVNSLLFRPLPVRAARDLGFIYDSDERTTGIQYRDYLTIRAASGPFSDVTAVAGDSARLRTDAGLVSLKGESVTANYFTVLGVSPRLGRGFATADEHDDEPVAVISESLWKARFGGDTDVLGRLLRIDVPTPYGGRYTGWRDYRIVGVMPSSFTGLGNPWQPADYWILFSQRQADFRPFYGTLFGRRPEDSTPVLPIGRLRDGVTFAEASAAIRTLGGSLLRGHSTVPGETLDLLPRPRVRLPFRGAYLFSAPRVAIGLTAVAMLLLVIAAFNLAGMLMARGFGRRSELAIRASLGARSSRLMRQSLIESALLSACGSCAGLLGSRLVIALLIQELPSQTMDASFMSPVVPVDARVLLFTICAAVVTALMTAFAPAIAAGRADLLSALKAGEATEPGSGTSRFRRVILVPQIAFALVLLIVAGVLVRSLLRLEFSPAGYDGARVIVADIQLPYRSIQTPADRAAAAAESSRAFAHILAAVRALPEVTAASATSETPMGSALPSASARVITSRDYRTTRRFVYATEGYVSADYFAVLAIPILRGRAFDTRDAVAPDQTVIVSDRLARELWPDADPLGERLAITSPDSGYAPHWLEVVGVVGSVTLPLDESPRPELYVPIQSTPQLASAIIVRGSGSTSQIAADIVTAAGRADGQAIVAEARTLNESVGAMRYPRRLSASLLGWAGAASLLIAVIGVFGLVSHAVAQRTREIGVRMVLGATRADVIQLVIVDAASVIGLGLGIGAVCAFAALRYASHALVPLPKVDTLTFLIVPAILSGAVLLACFIPARRAAGIDPNVALRHL